ncbi:hypothetical protein CR513_28061, partial [Mucuna pruriens]
MKNVVLLEATCCEGCWKEEREALLGLNMRLGLPLTWEWAGTDCCQWEGVECNSSTGRVTELKLYQLWSTNGPIQLDWHLNYSDFIVFKDLKSLNLSYNNWIVSCEDNEGLENLEVLSSNMDNAASIILFCLNRFSSLKSLYLSNNMFDATFNGPLLPNMKMKMKNVSVILLIFVLLEVMFCEGCWKEEREALLGLNLRFRLPLSWQWDGTDCCQWEGVECNSSTGRVAKLNLNQLWSSHVYDTQLDWHINYSDFIVFKDLKSLNLSYHYGIISCEDNEGLENLEVLDLSNMDNAASINLFCLNRLSSLKSLYLSSNMFDATFNSEDLFIYFFFLKDNNDRLLV